VGIPTGSWRGTASTPGRPAAGSGSLVLTDISGYTGYLLGTELEHAQDVLSDLMAVVVGTLQPPLRVTKLEGDAIFSYALDGACGASTLLDSIERSYFAFRSRQRDIAHATSCTCDACRQIPSLDLKFIVHHGSFVRRDLAGNEELTGRDVIVLHRLAKNSAADILGTKGYVMLTDASVDALGLEPEALGMRPHVERYEDVGEVRSCLEDLGERWSAETDRQRVYVAAEGNVVEWPPGDDEGAPAGDPKKGDDNFIDAEVVSCFCPGGGGCSAPPPGRCTEAQRSLASGV